MKITQLHHLLVIFQIQQDCYVPSAIPAKAIAEAISKCRRQLKTWLEVSMVSMVQARSAV